MSPLPANFNWSTGKAAMMGSIAYFLQTQIPDEFFDWDNPIMPVKLPGYGVTEKGLYNYGVQAFDDLLGYGQRYTYSGYSGVSGVSGHSGYSAFSGSSGYSSYGPLHGRKNQTLIEISAWDDVTKHANAVNKVRQMRDKVVYCLYNAGRVDDNGNLVMPPIKLYDFSRTPKVEMGWIELDTKDNAINEKFMVDPINQNLKTYRLLIRVYWYEYT